MSTVEIRLKSQKHPGLISLVDEEDFDRVSTFSWFILRNRHTSYAQTFVASGVRGARRKCLYLHRFITGALSGEYVDHINGDGLDNRRENLRICTASQNGANRHRQAQGTSSSFRGVVKHKGRWQAQVQVNGRMMYLGEYDSEIDAAMAYNVGAIKYFGEFARPNLIPIGYEELSNETRAA